MLQTDVLFSCAVGLHLATAAADTIRARNVRAVFTTRSFVYLLLYICLLVNPIGVYALLEFRGWKTLFHHFNYESVPGLWVAAYCVVNILSATVCYWIAVKLVRLYRDRRVVQVYSLLYSLAFAFSWTQYDRLFYAGTFSEWRFNTKHSYWDFTASQQGKLFLLSSCLLYIPILWAQTQWPAEESLMTKERRSKGLSHVIKCSAFNWAVCLGGMGFCQSMGLLPWKWDKFGMMTVGHVLVTCMILVPLFCIRCSKKSPKSTF